jgi:hypothetical protein
LWASISATIATGKPTTNIHDAKAIVTLAARRHHGEVFSEGRRTKLLTTKPGGTNQQVKIAHPFLQK